MIEIPDQYRIGSKGRQLNKQSFIPPSATTTEKRRLRECLRKVVLTHQITGETIPSRIDVDYHCEVIACLAIELSDIKHKDFVAKLLQPLFKLFAIFQFSDAQGQHALSFAHKRLNKNDPGNIVIAHAYCSASSTRPEIWSAIRFETLANRTSKRDLYLEAMTKAFLLDHPKLFIGAGKLLDSTLWYRGDSITELYAQLTALQSLKRDKQAAKTNAQKAALNTQIKTAIAVLKQLDTGTKRNPGSY
jgi:hypothetical protein